MNKRTAHQAEFSTTTWSHARQRKAGSGKHVDEAGLNALRYLDGTPKGSTRWIDTGWALALTEGG